MSTDRELLELAAKAAGFSDYYVSEWAGGASLMYYPDRNFGPSVWDPLNDDGDALRLAAKLVMSFRCDAADREFRAACFAIGAMGHPCPGDEWEVYIPIDPVEIGTTALYRKSAVKLAAAIGRGMR